MNGTSFCPLQPEGVTCTSRCAWFNAASLRCEVCDLSDNLNTLAETVSIIAAALPTEDTAHG